MEIVLNLNDHLHRNYVKLLLLLNWLWMFTGGYAYADLSYLKLKNTHELLKPEFQHLSPLYGFTSLNIIKNIRFNGHYGAEKNPFYCVTQIRSEKRQVDCPQDNTTSLIQQLFPSPDGVNFVANQGSKDDPLSRLPPETIGKLLTAISKAPLESLKDEKKGGAIKEEIKNGLISIICHSTGDKKTKMPATAKNKNIENNSLENCTAASISTSALSTTTHILNTISNETKAAKCNKIGKELANHFIDSLIGALQESQLKPPHYPERIVEKALLSYFWKKASDKKDILKLLSAMPEIANEKKLARLFPLPDNEKEWSEDNYKHQDYLSWKATVVNNTLSNEQLKQLVHNPELAAFYSQSEILGGGELPPVVSYAQAESKYLGGKGTYPDCGETSLRNFFNIVLYDRESQSFNVDQLTKMAAENKLPLSKELVAFYQKHPSTAELTDQAVRNDWSDVVSNLKHPHTVSYLKPRGAPSCEINVGISNMLKVIQALLGSTPDSDSKAPLSAQEKLRLLPTKLDNLCKILSRQGFTLDWSIAGKEGKAKKAIQSDTELTLQFSINGVNSFEWYFGGGHFAISAANQQKGLWRNDSILRLMEDKKANVAATGLLTDDSTVDIILQQEKKEVVSPALFFASSFIDYESKLKIIKRILEEKHKVLFSETLRLAKTLPDNDLHAQIDLFSSLLKLNAEEEEIFAPLKKQLEEQIVKNYQNVMFIAMHRDNLEIVKYLADKKPEALIEKNDWGQTPLASAAKCGNLEIVKYLAKKKPEALMQKDSKGRTPVELAKDNGSEEVADFLKKQIKQIDNTKSGAAEKKNN